MKEFAPLVPRPLESRAPRHEEVLPEVKRPDAAPGAAKFFTKPHIDPEHHVSHEQEVENFLSLLSHKAIVDGHTRTASNGGQIANFDGLNIRLKGVDDHDETTFVVLGHQTDTRKDTKLEKEGMPLPLRRTSKRGRGWLSKKLDENINWAGDSDNDLRTVLFTRKEKFVPVDVDHDTITIGRYNQYGVLTYAETLSRQEFGELIYDNYRRQEKQHEKQVFDFKQTPDRKGGKPKPVEHEMWWGDTHEFNPNRALHIDIPTDESKSVFRAIGAKQQTEGLDTLQGLTYKDGKNIVTVEGDILYHHPHKEGWKPERRIIVKKIDRLTGKTKVKDYSVTEFKTSLDNMSEDERMDMDARFRVPDPPAPEAPVPADVREDQSKLIERIALDVMPPAQEEKILAMFDHASRHGNLTPELRKEYTRAVFGSQRVGRKAIAGLFDVKGMYNNGGLNMTDPDHKAMRDKLEAQLKKEKVALFLLTDAEYISEDRREGAIDAYMQSPAGRRNLDSLVELIDQKGLAEVVDMTLKLQHSLHSSMRQLRLPHSSHTAWAANALAGQHFYNTHTHERSMDRPNFETGDPFDTNPANRLKTLALRRKLVDEMVGIEYLNLVIKKDSKVVPADTPGQKVNEKGEQKAVEKPVTEIDDHIWERVPEIVKKDLDQLVKVAAERVKNDKDPLEEPEQYEALGRALRHAVNHNN